MIIMGTISGATSGTTTPVTPLVPAARRTRSVTRIVAVAVVSATGALAPSVPAQADDTATASVSAGTPGCVSRDEWRQVHIVADGTGSGPGSGGTLRRVHRVFGTAGERVALDQPDPGFRYQVRRYQRCERAGWYRVTYHQYEADGVRTAWRSYWG